MLSSCVLSVFTVTTVISKTKVDALSDKNGELQVVYDDVNRRVEHAIQDRGVPRPTVSRWLEKAVPEYTNKTEKWIGRESKAMFGILFRELLLRLLCKSVIESLIHDTERGQTYFGNFVKMHDMIRDSALWIVSQEKLKANWEGLLRMLSAVQVFSRVPTKIESDFDMLSIFGVSVLLLRELERRLIIGRPGSSSKSSTKSMLQDGYFRNLQDLFISNGSIKYSTCLVNIPQLRFVFANDCPLPHEIIANDQAGPSTTEENFTELKQLNLHALQKLRGLCGSAVALRSFESIYIFKVDGVERGFLTLQLFVSFERAQALSTEDKGAKEDEESIFICIVGLGSTFNMSSSLPTPHLMDDEGNQTQGESAASVTHGGLRRRGRLRSIVWEHFEKKKINFIDKAVCNYCKNALVARSSDGTKHLHDHLKTCQVKKEIEATEFPPAKKAAGEKGKNAVETHFDPNVTRRKMARAIVMHEHPLSIVEHQGLRDVMSSLNQLWKPVSRNTIKKEILDMYECERAKYISVLEQTQDRIAITTDMWTAENQTKAYMAITAYFIDDAWALRSILLSFLEVPGSHTGQVLCDKLMGSLLELNIERKLSSIIVDNAATNDRMIDFMLLALDKNDLILGGQKFHVRCCAHILNLIVKDGLSVIGDLIANN
ncbi:BED-type domain-containing protein [Citrus sinensis]|uniref:BED-type domain-containing protein n=1 Tax=Citrus sinensis TaxID=2711 RepID=A0ACB8JEW9_CITSI|nr:BED-type domain-containing protein [Citrus sinensis]